MYILKGAICKNQPLVEFILSTVAAISLLAQLAMQLAIQTGSLVFGFGLVQNVASSLAY